MRVFEAQGILLMYSAVETSYYITRFAIKNTDIHIGAKVIKIS